MALHKFEVDMEYDGDAEADELNGSSAITLNIEAHDLTEARELARAKVERFKVTAVYQMT